MQNSSKFFVTNLIAKKYLKTTEEGNTKKSSMISEIIRYWSRTTISSQWDWLTNVILDNRIQHRVSTHFWSLVFLVPSLNLTSRTSFAFSFRLIVDDQLCSVCDDREVSLDFTFEQVLRMHHSMIHFVSDEMQSKHYSNWHTRRLKQLSELVIELEHFHNVGTFQQSRFSNHSVDQREREETPQW
jgi:hypothetical protein